MSQDKSASFMERALPFYPLPATRTPGLMLGTSGPDWQAAAGVFGEPVLLIRPR